MEWSVDCELGPDNDEWSEGQQKCIDAAVGGAGSIERSLRHWPEVRASFVET